MITPEQIEVVREWRDYQQDLFARSIDTKIYGSGVLPYLNALLQAIDERDAKIAKLERDIGERYQAYVEALRKNTRTVAEVRALEDREPPTARLEEANS